MYTITIEGLCWNPETGVSFWAHEYLKYLKKTFDRRQNRRVASFILSFLAWTWAPLSDDSIEELLDQIFYCEIILYSILLWKNIAFWSTLLSHYLDPSAESWEKGDVRLGVSLWKCESVHYRQKWSSKAMQPPLKIVKSRSLPYQTSAFSFVRFFSSVLYLKQCTFF